jgi:hypothetical protein
MNECSREYNIRRIIKIYTDVRCQTYTRDLPTYTSAVMWSARECKETCEEHLVPPFCSQTCSQDYKRQLTLIYVFFK